MTAMVWTKEGLYGVVKVLRSLALVFVGADSTRMNAFENNAPPYPSMARAVPGGGCKEKFIMIPDSLSPG